ncbi:hypothetical protein [Sphingobacterium paucimobilis]|uniref:Uncharacterized protein n=1 Tax=Sphingobacterium paucimobilis HER1398 TaxID=1346330 RepID=U2J7M0_9SPHI|nr:hypothetical protein [Sphingobacterium paucimobilis]ERJ58643.1 hypothetical protein M472_07680 [Sphingobacterium paucimobilis HER1398]
MNVFRNVLLLALFFIESDFLYAQKSDLRVYTLTLMGQNSQLGGNMVDLDKGRVYPIEEAGYNPKRIDFGFMYGRNTGGNLMVPISQGFLTFGDKFKEALLSWGNNRNNGTFINLGNTVEAQEIYQKIVSRVQIDALYSEWFDKIMTNPGYDPGKHGPGQRTRPIAVGDVVLFRSENKDTQHILRIVKFVQSQNGTLEIEVKSPLKNNKKGKL